MTALLMGAIAFLVVLIEMSQTRRFARWAMACVGRELVAKVVGMGPCASPGISRLRVGLMGRCVGAAMTQTHARSTRAQLPVARTPILVTTCPAVWARSATAESAAWDAGWAAPVCRVPAEPLVAAAAAPIAVLVTAQAMTAPMV